MGEEHQVSPGEYITPGVPRRLFNGVCGGCHGSISGNELDVAVTVDALTGASVSSSRDLEPQALR
jgi:mono/diheme cytochrome c family protein